MCVCAVILLLTHSAVKIKSVFESKLKLPEAYAKRLVFIMVDVNIRKCR